MAPTPPPRKILNVLITGFGPFSGYTLNPSWEAVKPLHGRTIGTEHGEVKLHVLQLPVKYSAVLDTLARVHASCISDKEFAVPHPALAGIAKPYCDEDWAEKNWAGDGRSYPLGYTSSPPDGGWDAVLHCGVGAPGKVRIETLARHAPYNHLDCTGQYAPRLDAGQATLSEETGLPLRHQEDGEDNPRGFPTAAFSDFAPTLTPDQAHLSPSQLLQHLQGILGPVPVELSTDAGLYLCEWTLYDSLAESARVAKASQHTPRPVLFVHCPPHTPPSEPEDVPTSEVTKILQEVALYMALLSL